MIHLASTRLLIITVLGLLFTVRAGANNIPYRHYSIAEGLPHENIKSIAQTADGRLWVGTSAGLSFYDGQGFQTVHFADAIGTVNVLEVQSVGREEVWVSTNHQGIWKVNNRRATRPFNELARVKASRVLIYNNTLYVFSQTAVWRASLNSDDIESIPFQYILDGVNGEKEAAGEVVSADISPEGAVWVLDLKRGPGMMLPDGSIHFLRMPAWMTSEGWHSIRFDERGMGWATHETRGLFRFEPDSGKISRVLKEVGVGHICITPQMIVVTSYNHGALYWDLEKNASLPPLNEAAGLPTNRINCIFRDHEGNAWIGTQIGLLHLNHPGVKHRVEVDTRPLVNLNNILLHENEEIWASSYTEGLFQLSPEYKSVQPQDEAQWSDLFKGQDGRLHALGMSGWYTYDSDRKWRQVQSYAGALEGMVDESGVGYFRHSTGLFRHEFMKPAMPLYTWPLAEQKYTKHILSEEGSILLWHNGRLIRIPKATRVSRKDGVELVRDVSAYKNVAVHDMSVDYLGRIWIALLNNGLLCVEPDTVVQLLPGHQVQGMSVEGDSLLMANTQDGLYVFNLPEQASKDVDHHLRADSTVRYHLSQVDGLLSSMAVEATFSPKFLWITHPGGVTQIPRHLLHREPPVPTVLLTSINYNGIERSPKRSIALDSNQRNIGFGFSATTYSRPHLVRYQYRLKGFEKTWSETHHSFVQYAGLPAGVYTFEVKAAASPEQFGQAASYAFTIPRPFYQTPIFWMIALVAMGSLMYRLHKYRVRSILQVERTRTQIAMDLHDDVGSSLTSLSFLSSLAQERTERQAPREEITPLLREVGSMASELVDNMLDIVWSVDPNHDTIGSVTSRIQAFYQRLEGASDVIVEWQMATGVEDISLPPRSRRNLYLILKEALNNAIKHSNASKIKVEFARTLVMLRIEIKDDGQGFDAKTILAGYGLKTMKDRAEESNASLTIHSSQGDGTSIYIQWPLK